MPSCDARKTRTNEQQPAWPISLSRDKRLRGNSFGGIAIALSAEVCVPIKITVRFEYRRSCDFIECRGWQILQQRGFTQVHTQAVFTIRLLDMLADCWRAAHQIAQPLPANLE